MMIGLGFGMTMQRPAAGGGGGGGTAALFQSVNANGWSNTYASPPTFAPDVTPEYFTVSRQGFDATGAAVTVSEDMINTQRIRQPYPNQASLTTNQVSISDYIYSTDTIAGVTNNSAEVSPKPVANWARPDDHMVVGNSVHLEVVAFHRNARAREEIACVEFSATDGTTTVSQKVGTSTILGHAGDQFPVIGYACDLDISTLANPATVTCNAKVYPWIGGAASVLDSAASAVLREFSPRVYLRNTTLAAAPVYVYVNATTGNDTTGVVSTTAALAEAAPCLTVAGAINRAHTVNAAQDGVIIRLMVGTHVFSTTAIIATRTQATGELTITRDPNATRANAILSCGGATVRARLGAAGGWLRIKDVSVLRAGTSQFSGEATSQLLLVFENVNFDNGAFNAAIVGGNADMICLGVTFTNPAASILSAGTREIRMIRGCIAAPTSSVEGWLVLGCHITNMAGALSFGARSGDGSILGFSRFTGISSTTGVVGLGATANIAQAATVQNIFEYTSATSGPAVRVSADATTGNNTHVIIHNNTHVGFFNNGRDNTFYDEGPTRRFSKLMSVRGNIVVAINTKGDVFRGTVEAGADASSAIGNWPYKYGVGCEANFSQFADALVSTFPAPSGAQDYPGLAANIGTSASVRNDPLFTTYAGTTSGPTAGAGGGNYALQSGSPCKAKVKRPVLRFDMAGATRSATLATIGAYE